MNDIVEIIINDSESIIKEGTKFIKILEEDFSLFQSELNACIQEFKHYNENENCDVIFEPEKILNKSMLTIMHAREELVKHILLRKFVNLL